MDASSNVAAGGNVTLQANDIRLGDGAVIDATGATGGGDVLVGGDWQGSGDLHQATTVTMAASATIDASATRNGDGGTVVLWSDVNNSAARTRAHGTIWAKGGADGGDGGRIETSGHWLDIAGSQGGASASHGAAGKWLLDPYNVTITSGNANGAFGSAGGTDTWTPNADNSTILNTDINNKLENGTNVTVTTTGAGSQIGDITVASAITKASGNTDVTLRLNAANSIVVNQAISNSGGTGRLHVVLDADNNNGTGDGAGIVLLNADITTNGGNLSFGTGRTAMIGGVSTLVGGDVYVAGAGARTLSTNGGSVNVQGEMIVANTNGLTINSNGGNVRFYGLLNSGNQYSYVDGPDGQTNSWDWARTDARNGTAGGATLGDSYLVTIMSRLENAVAVATGGYRGAWIGAYRPNYASGNWVWSDGPEANLHFFTQPAGGSGGSVTSGSYANFGAGEPNGCMTAASCETVGQFFGTGGQWNDLGASTAFSATQSSQYAVLGYIRETNLAASPITINAGAGTVTFSGAVGSSKTLAALDVTAGGGIAINGGAVATQGTQTYNSAVQLGADTLLTTRQSNITFNSTVDSDSPASPRNLTATISPNTTYYWVDWTSADANNVYGTITIGGDVINVTYSNAQGYAFAQTSGGTNYWTYSGGTSPYVSSNVANGPASADIIALRYAGEQTLTFSQPVENLGFSVVSLNGNGYGFNQDFTIESYTGYNGAGTGYYGTGTLSKTTNGSTYNLNGTAGEPHGTIRFANAFSDLTWNSLSNEFWNGFTVGVTGTSANAGSVHFNGAVGAAAALGAVTVNAGMQTTDNIIDASSLTVSGLSNLGGNITTSGNQSYGSAVTLNADVLLTTTSNGSVNAISSIDGAQALTIQTAGTGDITLSGAVGGNTALTGLTLATDVLTASDISLAPSAALSVTNGGTSAITGVISGTGVTATKAGSGTLTLSGANTYTGGTTVSGGVLALGRATTGSITNGPVGTGAVTVNSGAALDLAGFSLANALTLSGTGVSDSGALYNSTNTAVTVSGATTLAADATIKSEAGGNLIYSGTIDGAHTLTIDTNGPVSDAAVTINGVVGGSTPLTGMSIDSGSGTVTDGVSGYLVAGNLVLLGGNVTLDNASNTVGTLAASGVGALTYVNSGALTLGTVGVTNGISVSGAVNVATLSGALTLAQNISTTDTGASAVLLNAGRNASAGSAAGGDLIVSGSPTVSVGVGGRATLYTGSLSGSTGLTTLVGAGSGRFRYNSDEVASNYALALGTGVHAVYREQPTITAVAVDNQSITYGDATPAWTFTLSGGQNGDTLAQAFVTSPTMAVGGTTSTSGNYTVGDHTVTASGGLGSSQLGYANFTASYSSGTLTVTPKALDVTWTGVNKVYDGGTAASVTTADDREAGDVLSIARTAAFASRNAANGSTINLSGVSLSGADAANYSVAATASTTADITPAALTISTSAVSKIYDGGTAAAGNAIVSAGTLFGGDALSGGSFAFTDANVGSGNKTVTASGVTVNDGNSGNNYSVAYANNTASSITPYVVNLTGNRVYDGTTALTAGVFGLGTLVGSETLMLTGTGSLADRHAGNGKAVTLGTLALGDGSGLASNYTLSGGTHRADITPAALMVSTTAVSKIYDGSSAAAGSATLSAGTLFGGDTLAGGSFAFTDANVGAGNKTVTVSGVTVNDGNGGGNYTMTYVNNTTSTITPRPLTLSAVTDSKAFDGTTHSSRTPVADNLASGDALIDLQQAFDSNAIGARLLNVVDGYQIDDGNGGGNYTVTLVAAAGEITNAAPPPQLPPAQPQEPPVSSPAAVDPAGASNSLFDPAPLFAFANEGGPTQEATGSAGSAAWADFAGSGETVVFTLGGAGDTVTLTLGKTGGGTGSDGTGSDGTGSVGTGSVGTGSSGGAVIETALPLFRQDGADTVAVGQFQITRQGGGRWTATPGAAATLRTPTLAAQTVRSATLPVNLPDGAAHALTVAYSAEGVLIVEAPAEMQAFYDERHVLLLALEVARQRLTLEPDAVTAVVIQWKGRSPSS